MSIQTIGINAYTKALGNFQKAEKDANITPEKPASGEFSQVFQQSLSKVNELQKEKSAMITAFASGESQNVHELMISLQKASIAMNMTAAVRNKAIEAYKELTRLQF